MLLLQPSRLGYRLYLIRKKVILLVKRWTYDRPPNTAQPAAR